MPDLIGHLSATDVVDYALSHDPGVKIAGWNLDNARRELNTAVWQLLPSLSVNAGWSTSYFNYPGQDIQLDPFRDQLRNHQGEYIQFSMSIPIYNRLQGQDNVARKRNAVRKMTAQFDQKQRDVASEVRRAVQDRDGAAAAYDQACRKARTSLWALPVAATSTGRFPIIFARSPRASRWAAIRVSIPCAA